MLKNGKKFLSAIVILATMNSKAETAEWVKNLGNVTANLSPTNYTVTSISGSSQVIGKDPLFGFPTAKLYTFKLCASHQFNQHPFKDKLILVDGATVPLRVQVLDDTCLSWTENINFHFTAPARYVTLQRSLTITKAQPAPPNGNPLSRPEAVLFQFAINPWLHGETSAAVEIADFIKIKPSHSVPAEQGVEALQGKLNSAPDVAIIANDARINFQELAIDSTNGGRFLFDFRTNPQIEVLSAAGQPVPIKLNQGEFEFEAFLLSSLYEGNQQVQRIINPKPLRGKALLKEGMISFQQEIILPLIPSRGRLELAISLKATQKSSYLRPYKGVYLMGDYTDLKGNLFSRLKTGASNANPNFNFESYIGKQDSSLQNTDQNSQDGLRRLKYEFEPLSFKLTRIGNESATRRQVYYQVRACIRNGIDNSPLRAYHFEISKAETSDNNSSSMAPTVRQSEYDSCIYWDDHIDHKYYATQKYFRAEYKISNTDLNLNEHLAAYINPWDISLSRDARTVDSAELTKETNTSKIPAQIFIPNYQLQTRTIEYSLDSLLRLTIRKKVHLLIEPKIINYSNLSNGINSREALRDGVWKLRWALLHNRYENSQTPYRLLSRGETLVMATNGRIVAPLELAFDDFRYLNSRNYLMLEIAPIKGELVMMDPQWGPRPADVSMSLDNLIDTDSGLNTQSFIGPIFTSGDGDSNYLIPHPSNPALAAFIEGAQEQGPQAGHDELISFERAAPTWSDLPAPVHIQSTPPAVDLKSLQNKLYLQGNQITSWELNSPEDLRKLRHHLGPSAFTLQNLSQQYQRPLFTSDILERSFTGNSLSAEMQDRLCFYFFDENPRLAFRLPSSLLPWRPSDFWLRKCLRSVGKQDQTFFRAQKELIVDSISETHFLGSIGSTLSVNASFSVNNSESTSLSETLSASTQIGIGSSVNKVISIGAGGSYSLSRTQSEGINRGNGVSVSSGVSLNIKKLAVKASGTYRGRCLTIELDPRLYDGREKQNLFEDVKRITDSHEKTEKYLTQKARFCVNGDSPQPFTSIEDFYFVFQDNSNSGFIDGPDLRNRPLMLQLRGQQAYENFLRFIDSKMTPPQETNQVSSDLSTIEDRTHSALKMTVPSFPGLIIEPMTMGQRNDGF